MPLAYKKLRIFLASPSDVATDRAKLETVVESLTPTTDYLGLIVETIDWHDCMPRAGRPQKVIFDQVDPSTWDIFIGILWHRFGTPPAAADPITQKEYLSGTEEEFRKAYRLYRETGRPEIMMYRCKRPYPIEMDPEQLIMVRNFFKEIENPAGSSPVLVRDYDTTESFEKMMLDHLQKMLIDYGDRAKKPISPEVARELAPTIPNNLPRRQPFFGRAKEIAEIMRALSPTDRTWGVLLDGIGGIGKTALAIESGHQAQETGLFDAFVFVSAKTNRLDPDGIRELDTSAHTLADFLNETARILGQPGITKLTKEEKRRALLDELKTRKTLLIYDNLETLSKEDQEAVADFLRDLPSNCKAIITSRRRGGEGAIWLRVETLDLEAALKIIDNEIRRDSSLAKKLLPLQTRWHELYDETNGSPLALVHILGLMRVRASLSFDNALAMLRGSGQNDDLTKFIYQEASKELSNNDKTALGALSFFAPTASFEAWSAVAGLSRIALQTSIDRLSALSLLDNPAGEERFGLHPLTRNFIRQGLLTDPQKAYQQGMQFAKYWEGYARQYGGNTTVSYKTYPKLEAEWSNLNAAANWLWETTRLEENGIHDKEASILYNNIVNSMAQGFLLKTGRWEDMLQWVTRAYQVVSTENNLTLVGERASEISWVYYNWGDYDNATLWADRCMEIALQSPGNYYHAKVLNAKGAIARLGKDLDESERYLKEALAIHQSRKDDVSVAVMLGNLGNAELDRDNLSMAEKYYKDALAISEKIDYATSKSAVYFGLGSVSYKRKDYSEARKYYEQALSLAKELSDQSHAAVCNHNIALTYEQQNEPAKGLPFALEALEIRRRIKHPNYQTTFDLVARLQSRIAGLDK